MQNEIEMLGITQALSRATGVRHVYDERLEERGGGPVQSVVTVATQRYLAWLDMDTGDMVVSPVELWDPTNLTEALDDDLPVLSVRNGGSGLPEVVVSHMGGGFNERRASLLLVIE
jgi:hypothetical protein